MPTARELAINADAQALIELAELSYALSRPFAAPPGVPADRAKALQDAFAAAHRDAQFLKEATAHGIDISPVDAAGVMKALDGIDKASPAVLAYLNKLFATGNKG